MNNKSIIMKILVSCIVALFLALFIVVFSLIKTIMPKKQVVDTKEIITQEYSLENIENLSFNFKKSNVIFMTTNEEKLKITQDFKEEKFYLNNRNNGLKISFEEDNYIINSKKKKYIIYVPESYQNSINIVNGFGSIKISGIGNDIEINNNSGKLTLDEIGNVKITDVSGNIFIANIIGNVQAKTSTGDIKIENIIGSINAETIAGNIEVINFDVLDVSDFENISGNIVIDMSESSMCMVNYSSENGKVEIDENVCLVGFNLINVKNVTGLIKIN